MLFIVATPIGNLKDITFRAVEVLESVDGIICEDTRHASLLLNHYKINKPLLALNDFNEAQTIPRIIEKLVQGNNLALISDAGTPLVSDPGYKLVRECIAEGLEVDSLPGPSAPITALTLSGLPPDKFLFVGYLPEKPGKRKEMLKNLLEMNSKIPQTFIAFVSPHKILGTLKDLQESYGDIEIVLAKELTKIYQNVDKKRISEWLPLLKNPKGEFVMLFRL